MVLEDHDDCTVQEPPRPTSGSSSTASSRLRRQVTQSVNEYRDYIQTLPKEIRNLFAGGVAGMIAKTVVAPVDRIKILYQVSSRPFHIKDLPHMAYQIYTKEGITALWKGNMATMIRVFPYSGLQFMVFDRCKTFFLARHEADDNKRRQLLLFNPKTTTTTTEPRSNMNMTSTPNNTTSTSTTTSTKTSTTMNGTDTGPSQVKRREWGLSALESLISGSIAGVCSTFFTYPLDMTRAQLAVLKKQKHQRNDGFVQVLMKNYQERGVSGLYRGITPTMLGILPYAGIAFTLNEQAKRKIQNYYRREPTTIEKIQCGAISGLFAQTLTYPLEVTRRRMQTMGVADSAVGMFGLGHAATCPPTSTTVSGATATASRPLPPPPPAPTMIWTLRDVFQEQGYRGLFKGVTLNWMKGPVAFSISFTVFDIMQAWVATDVERELRMPRRKSNVGS